RLASELGQGGTTAPPGRENGRLREWFQACERDHRFVVYEAAPGVSSWTDQCIRQADQVVIVSRADSPWPPAETGGQAARERPPARRDLVLLRAGASAGPSDPAAIDGHRVFHHHVDPASGADVARLARLITNRSVGLVLGGGGARAFAHIGVL